MKLVGVREAQQQLSGLVAVSQKESVVLTRHGRPVAVLTGVEGQDLEDVLLAHDPSFWKLIEKRRQYSGALLSHEDVLASLARDAPKERPVKERSGQGAPRKPPRKKGASGRSRKAR